MYKIAVVGDKDSVLAFRVLGIDVFIAYEKDETRKIISRHAADCQCSPRTYPQLYFLVLSGSLTQVCDIFKYFVINKYVVYYFLRINDFLRT